jgi:hypothetical protein
VRACARARPPTHTHARSMQPCRLSACTDARCTRAQACVREGMWVGVRVGGRTCVRVGGHVGVHACARTHARTRAPIRPHPTCPHAHPHARTHTRPSPCPHARTHTHTHARTRTHAHTRARTHASTASRQAGRQACRQAAWLGGQAEKQAGRKNFDVLLERVRFNFCTITFAYVRPTCRLRRRNLEKVRPPSKVS